MDSALKTPSNTIGQESNSIKLIGLSNLDYAPLAAINTLLKKHFANRARLWKPKLEFIDHSSMNAVYNAHRIRNELNI